MYRLGQCAIVDTNDMGMNAHQKRFGSTYLPSAAKASLLDGKQKILKDYLAAVLQNDRVYSFPLENASQPQLMDSVELSESADAHGLDTIEYATTDDIPHFFLVVSTKDSRKELVEPASCDWKSMNFPILITELSIHKSTDGEILSLNDCMEHFVFSAGRPIWVDALRMMSWTTVKRKLLQWKCDQVCSAEPGCMRIYCPIACRNIKWFEVHLWKYILEAGIASYNSFVSSLNHYHVSDVMLVSLCGIA